MINNDVLRRLRYVFDLSDSKMMSLASSKDKKITRAEVSDWLKKDDDDSQKVCSDVELAIFLNSFIDEKRGKKEGPQRPPEKRLTNNVILMKLRIALNLQAEDMIDILALANFKLSKHELSAFFRKPGHKHYRECKDQILRNFLHGLQVKVRPSSEGSKPKPKNSAKPKAKSVPSVVKSDKKEASLKEPESSYKWKKLDSSK